MARSWLVAVAVALAACGSGEPRRRVGVRLVERLPAAPGAAQGTDCVVGDERRPALGCSSWEPVSTTVLERSADRVVIRRSVPPWHRARLVYLKAAWRGPGPDAPLVPAGDVRVTRNDAPWAKLVLPALGEEATAPTRQVTVHSRLPSVGSVETDAVAVPRGAVLRVGLALDPSVPVDGVEAVEFVASADAGSGPHELLRTRLSTVDGAARWTDYVLDLRAVTGPATGFRFETRIVAAAGADPARLAAIPLWGAPEILVPEADPAPPNLLLVSLDTLRADHVGTRVGDVPLTPHLDALAAEGVTVEQATTTYPSTTAEHASMLTGLYPIRHGVFAPTRQLGPVPTLATVLAAAGWRTGAVTEDVMLAASVGFPRGFSRYRELPEVEPAAPESRKPAQTFDAAVAWLEAHATDRFFLFVHSYAVHWPYAPPAEYAVAAPPDARFGSPAGTSPEQVELHRLYAGEVRYADAQVGRLVDAIRRRGLADRTLVVVTSDHGEEFGEHGGRSHSHALYDEVMRVPLVLWAPGRLPAGRRVRTPTSLADLVPTLLDLLGVAVPPGLDGASQAAHIRGTAEEDPERPVFAQLEPNPRARQRVLAARTATVKWLLTASEPLRLEAFDLIADPGERHPLDDPALLERGRALIGGYAALGSAAVAAPETALDPGTQARLRALGYAD